MLATLEVTEPLVPGAYRDVAWTWVGAAPFDGGSEQVYAILDITNAVDEFDESNNVGSVRLFNSPCVGDVNSDGTVDIDDLFAILAAWGPCDGCPEDVNADGVVDIDDIFEVLANWGPCS